MEYLLFCYGDFWMLCLLYFFLFCSLKKLFMLTVHTILLYGKNLHTPSMNHLGSICNVCVCMRIYMIRDLTNSLCLFFPLTQIHLDTRYIPIYPYNVLCIIRYSTPFHSIEYSIWVNVYPKVSTYHYKTKGGLSTDFIFKT